MKPINVVFKHGKSFSADPISLKETEKWGHVKVMPSVCVRMLSIFHDVWYEGYAIGRHSNRVIFISYKQYEQHG
jgi:hypothetical protein